MVLFFDRNKSDKSLYRSTVVVVATSSERIITTLP
jgi:hypothetical protein